MKEGTRRRLTCLLAAATAVLALSPQMDAVAKLPEMMVLNAGSAVHVPVSAAVSAGVAAEDGTAGLTADHVSEGGVAIRAEGTGEGEVVFSLLGILPLKKVKVSVQPRRVLVPGGQSVGVAMNTRGVVVVGNSDLGRTPSPARLAGIKSGDVIRSVDGEAVTSARQLSMCLADGAAARLELLRGDETIECDIQPAQDSRDGQYRLGAWVRDSTAGVGTLTFYDPQTGGYGALGHAITDVDTGVVMPVGEGELYANRVVAVTPSREGAPGELTGDFFAAPVSLGDVTFNSDYGIFGRASEPIRNTLYPEGLTVAGLDQVHAGPASLLTTLDGSEVREYACEIVRLNESSAASSRAMVIRVTDERLLAKTGGIVQGMSGSPLIQDGRIIGAVTHVMVNDPTMGYGIGIETMLSAAG